MKFKANTPQLRDGFFRAKGENGVSLVIVMVFLVILSGLGITAMQSSTLSARISRNEADRNIAHQAAEAALVDAENDIFYLRADRKTPCVTAIIGCRAEPGISKLEGFNTTCPGGLCNGLVTPPWQDTITTGTLVPNLWKANNNDVSVAYGLHTGAAPLPFVAQQPRYLIEGFKVGDDYVYRVTAKGFGANLSTQVMLQTTVKP
jgi:type IV pilus assembly protein PilX